jgi:hypothetical protein
MPERRHVPASFILCEASVFPCGKNFVLMIPNDFACRPYNFVILGLEFIKIYKNIFKIHCDIIHIVQSLSALVWS